MNDDRLLITDGVHTENTEGNGGPQADDGGEQQLSKIGQQLKGNYWLFTHYIFSAVFIKLRKFLITDGVHTENTDDTEVRKQTMVGNSNCQKLDSN